MKQLRSITATVLLAAFLAGPAMAQEKMGKMDQKKEAMPLKDHKCTAACKNGKHVYAHGEKGHKCGPECKKMMKEGKM
jgi:hypothetical protein